MPDLGLTVTIVSDSSGPQCESGCATDWSRIESLDLARKKMTERFGGEATLQHVDLSGMADNDFVREVRLEIQGMPLPALLVNGRPRIAGAFDLRQLMDVVEADLEARLA